MSLSEKISSNLHEPSYVNRDTQHDVPADLADNHQTLPRQIQRLGAVALPFFALERRFGLLVTFVGNSSRLYTDANDLTLALTRGRVLPIGKAAIRTAISATALATMVISPAASMVITTAQDMVYYFNELYSALDQDDYKKAYESLARILASGLYLGLFFSASVELTLLSMAVQILLGFYQSSEEFRKGHYLEGSGHLVMSALRIHQMQPHIQTLQFKWELESILASLPEEHFVGELGENWKFPSDHLPIGGEINGKTIGSWNVLDTNYIDWVTEKNTQGIHGGLISRLNRESSVMKGLTVREVLIIHQICSMVDRPDRPFKILALQECNSQFIRGLQCMLPRHIGIVYQDPHLYREDQEIVLYNKNDFDYLAFQSSRLITDAYPSAPGRPLMEIVFQDKVTGEKFQIFCTHIPGDPNLPCRFEFAAYVVAHKKEDAITIALGDMNFNPEEMQEAFNKADPHDKYEFENPIKYYTNIGPNKKAKNIDQMWVASADNGDVEVVGLMPDEVLPGLQYVVNHILPESQTLKTLYTGKQINFLRFMTQRWHLYLDRLKEWEKMSQLAVK